MFLRGYHLLSTVVDCCVCDVAVVIAVFVVTQPGGTPVRINPPLQSMAGARGGHTAGARGGHTAGVRGAHAQRGSTPTQSSAMPPVNQASPLRYTVSGGHVRPSVPGTLSLLSQQTYPVATTTRTRLCANYALAN